MLVCEPVSSSFAELSSLPRSTARLDLVHYNWVSKFFISRLMLYCHKRDYCPYLQEVEVSCFCPDSETIQEEKNVRERFRETLVRDKNQLWDVDWREGIREFSSKGGIDVSLLQWIGTDLGGDKVWRCPTDGKFKDFGQATGRGLGGRR